MCAIILRVKFRNPSRVQHLELADQDALMREIEALMGNAHLLDALDIFTLRERRQQVSEWRTTLAEELSV